MKNENQTQNQKKIERIDLFFKNHNYVIVNNSVLWNKKKLEKYITLFLETDFYKLTRNLDGSFFLKNLEYDDLRNELAKIMGYSFYLEVQSYPRVHNNTATYEFQNEVYKNLEDAKKAQAEELRLQYANLEEIYSKAHAHGIHEFANVDDVVEEMIYLSEC